MVSPSEKAFSIVQQRGDPQRLFLREAKQNIAIELGCVLLYSVPNQPIPTGVAQRFVGGPAHFGYVPDPILRTHL